MNKNFSQLAKSIAITDTLFPSWEGLGVGLQCFLSTNLENQKTSQRSNKRFSPLKGSRGINFISPILNFSTKFFLLIFTLLLLQIEVQAQPSQGLKKLVNRFAEEYTEKENTYGLAVGIIDGVYDYQYYYGHLTEGNYLPPADSTVFEIGGGSKLFAATLMALMSLEGQIHLDSSIAPYLPDSLQENPFLQSLTFHHLATHTARLPKKPFNLYSPNPENPYEHYQQADLYDLLDNLNNDLKPQKRYRYSHLGYGLLGNVLASASQLPYDSLLEQKVLGPLGMTESGNHSRKNQVIGHDFRGTEIPAQELGAMAPSLGLRMTLPNALAFVKANLTAEIGKGRLSESLLMCQEIQQESHQKKVFTGYGWHILDQGKKFPKIYTHSGSTKGFRYFVAFIKETQTAVVLLANSTEHIDVMGFELLELLNR